MRFSRYCVRLIVVVLFFISVPGCCPQKRVSKKSALSDSKREQYIDVATLKEILPTANKPITILIHGTRLMPLLLLVPGLARQVVNPSGLHRAADIDATYLYARIARSLAHTDPQQFPLENTYLFGWSGVLSFKSRKKAAERLYQAIRELRNYPDLKNTPITIISVSHGGNVALNLAGVAAEHGDTSLQIDRLVLLCSPIQDATAKYAHSTIFKKVYNLHSAGEMVQIADPQALYCCKEMGCTPQYFFSHRLIKPAAPHIIQAEIAHKKRHLCHLDFAMPHFIKRLPRVLNHLDGPALLSSASPGDQVFKIDLNTLPR